MAEETLPTARHRCALTLVELLVVIGIIAILMTLLIVGAAKLIKAVQSLRGHG